MRTVTYELKGEIDMDQYNVFEALEQLKDLKDNAEEFSSAQLTVKVPTEFKV